MDRSLNEWLALNVRVVYISDRIVSEFKIPTLEPKKHKKISAVFFDERLQRICYNQLEDLVEIGKIFICFCKNQIR